MNQCKCKIILVDDHKIFRDGIRALFIFDDEIEVVDEAENAEGLLKILKYLDNDVIILMDIGIPGISGISLTSKIKQKNPGIKIIMLSADKSEYSISEAIKSGADGYLHKDTSVDEIKKAIRSVKNNKEYFGNSISGSVFRSYANKIREGKKHASKSLSDREIEIVRYISEGLTYKEIGNKLHISTRTVESHKNNILQKLDVKTIPELIKAAIKHNYINPELS